MARTYVPGAGDIACNSVRYARKICRTLAALEAATMEVNPRKGIRICYSCYFFLGTFDVHGRDGRALLRLGLKRQKMRVLRMK
jgi:hypothetical protein